MYIKSVDDVNSLKKVSPDQEKNAIVQKQKTQIILYIWPYALER